MLSSTDPRNSVKFNSIIETFSHVGRTGGSIAVLLLLPILILSLWFNK